MVFKGLAYWVLIFKFKKDTGDILNDPIQTQISHIEKKVNDIEEKIDDMADFERLIDKCIMFIRDPGSGSQASEENLVSLTSCQRTNGSFLLKVNGLSLTPPTALRFCFSILFLLEDGATGAFRSPQFFSLKMNWPLATFG